MPIPRSHPIDFLRTKIWCHLLLRRTYPRTAYKLAMVIDGGPYERTRWQNYLNGTSRAFPHNGKDSVALAEQKFPGSRQPFDSAIWHVLKGGRLTIPDCYDELAKLGPDMHFVFLSGKASTNLHSDIDPRTIDEIFDLLLEFPTFDALQSLILLMAMMETAEQPSFRNEVCLLYRFMIPSFIERGDIPVHGEIFDAVDAVMRYRWRDPEALNSLIEIDYPWTAVKPRDDGELPPFRFGKPTPAPRLDQPWKRSK